MKGVLFIWVVIAVAQSNGVPQPVQHEAVWGSHGCSADNQVRVVPRVDQHTATQYIAKLQFPLKALVCHRYVSVSRKLVNTHAHAHAHAHTHTHIHSQLSCLKCST